MPVQSVQPKRRSLLAMTWQLWCSRVHHLFQWSLVCGNGWYVSLTATMFLVGFMVGAAMVGPTADTYDFLLLETFSVALYIIILMFECLLHTPNLCLFESIKILQRYELTRRWSHLLLISSLTYTLDCLPLICAFSM